MAEPDGSRATVVGHDCGVPVIPSHARGEGGMGWEGQFYYSITVFVVRIITIITPGNRSMIIFLPNKDGHIIVCNINNFNLDLFNLIFLRLLFSIKLVSSCLSTSGGVKTI